MNILQTESKSSLWNKFEKYQKNKLLWLSLLHVSKPQQGY